MNVVAGAGHVVVGESDVTCDPAAFLKVRKSRKYMGVQDDLAVVAAGRAIANAGLSPGALGERAGLYLAVGYIPFDEASIGPVLLASTEDGRFSMARFGGGGFQRAHPLLTFRCLPNMPAYHVSVNFDVQGPYLVTYPGAAQFYLALDEANAALLSGEIDVALVGGVAHQKNFLVEHHFSRVVPPLAKERLRDAAAFLVIEREEDARTRAHEPRGRLESLSIAYEPFDPLTKMPEHAEQFSLSSNAPSPPSDGELGPASLAAALSRAWQTSRVRVVHELASRDGVRAKSVWS